MRNPVPKNLPPTSNQSASKRNSVTLADDTLCKRCAYNLRGLSTIDSCPECGTSVSASIHGDLLRSSDPLWVGVLARGALWISAGVALMLLGIVPVTVFASAGSPLARYDAEAIHSHRIFFRLALLVANIPFFFGTWWITRPDPTRIGEKRYGIQRKIVRIALMLYSVGAIVDPISLLTTMSLPMKHLLEEVVCLVSLATFVGSVAQMDYLAKLAQRIPAGDLSDRAIFLRSAMGTTYGFISLVEIISALVVVNLAPSPGQERAVAYAFCGMSVLNFAQLVFGVIYLVMMNKFRRRLSEQAILAKQSWQYAHPVPARNPVRGLKVDSHN